MTNCNAMNNLMMQLGAVLSTAIEEATRHATAAVRNPNQTNTNNTVSSVTATVTSSRFDGSGGDETTSGSSSSSSNSDHQHQDGGERHRSGEEERGGGSGGEMEDLIILPPPPVVTTSECFVGGKQVTITTTTTMSGQTHVKVVGVTEMNKRQELQKSQPQFEANLVSNCPLIVESHKRYSPPIVLQQQQQHPVPVSLMNGGSKYKEIVS